MKRLVRIKKVSEQLLNFEMAKCSTSLLPFDLKKLSMRFSDMLEVKIHSFSCFFLYFRQRPIRSWQPQICLLGTCLGDKIDYILLLHP